MRIPRTRTRCWSSPRLGWVQGFRRGSRSPIRGSLSELDRSTRLPRLRSPRGWASQPRLARQRTIDRLVPPLGNRLRCRRVVISPRLLRRRGLGTSATTGCWIEVSAIPRCRMKRTSPMPFQRRLPRIRRLTRAQLLTLATWRWASVKLDLTVHPDDVLEQVALHATLATLRELQDPFQLFPDMQRHIPSSPSSGGLRPAPLRKTRLPTTSSIRLSGSAGTS